MNPSSAGLPFPGSAAVAQLAVNELVVGSNPTRGALENNPHKIGLFFMPVVELELFKKL